MSAERRSLATLVGAKAARKLSAHRRAGDGVWFGLGMLGVVGWSVVVPTLAGVLLGLRLDQRQPGSHRWTLALLVAGLVLGCANAWHWVVKESRAIRKHEDLTHD